MVLVCIIARPPHNLSILLSLYRTRFRTVYQINGCWPLEMRPTRNTKKMWVRICEKRTFFALFHVLQVNRSRTKNFQNVLCRE